MRLHRTDLQVLMALFAAQGPMTVNNQALFGFKDATISRLKDLKLIEDSEAGLGMLTLTPDGFTFLHEATLTVSDFGLTLDTANDRLDAFLAAKGNKALPNQGGAASGRHPSFSASWLKFRPKHLNYLMSLVYSNPNPAIPVATDYLSMYEAMGLLASTSPLVLSPAGDRFLKLCRLRGEPKKDRTGLGDWVNAMEGLRKEVGLV